MTALWTSDDAARAAGGRATAAWVANGVSIDTREIAPGDLFVALKDIRDGHDFVAQALAAGASAALVSRIPDGVPADAPLLLVDDVLPALERMGIHSRARTRAKVIAVTGSVGKTSTKEMLRAVLGRQGKVHAAEKSFNNHWGVPLTLARMPADADFAVLEIGMNHPGEIAPLVRMCRPHVAMITTVAAAHLEAFENVEGIAREKAAIFEGLEPKGIAIINGDLDTTPLLVAAAKKAGARIVTFGMGASNHHRILELTQGESSTVARARAWRTPMLLKVSTPGRHFAVNGLGVIAAATALGADRARALCALGQWSPPAGRGTRERLAMDIVDDHMTFDLIDDAFNANPASMAASLEVLAAARTTDGLGRYDSGRRIAILGDMLELGTNEVELHADIAALPAMKNIQLVHCAGPLMRALYEALPDTKRGLWFDSAPKLAARAHSIVDAGDVILVKGSKGSKVSLVVDAIRKLGHPAQSDQRGTE
ncbi:UDP-N-acetylmuramoyl-tripeptide--D-alanyl-D-alanine ligase [Pseudogemmobacter sp. W21_MBD1_M6]|uniref:UDP-N-acetylmuramoyl-tripeptide--D-alanyl-D- alanine ligase n=1 Tax=Pseudogemmobacter sp. W21_MBD1_M6 TaxID=3240271 RepID=UPI003F9CC7E0